MRSLIWILLLAAVSSTVADPIPGDTEFPYPKAEVDVRGLLQGLKDILGTLRGILTGGGAVINAAALNEAIQEEQIEKDQETLQSPCGPTIFNVPQYWLCCLVQPKMINIFPPEPVEVHMGVEPCCEKSPLVLLSVTIGETWIVKQFFAFFISSFQTMCSLDLSKH